MAVHCIDRIVLHYICADESNSYSSLAPNDGFIFSLILFVRSFVRSFVSFVFSLWQMSIGVLSFSLGCTVYLRAHGEHLRARERGELGVDVNVQ